MPRFNLFKGKNHEMGELRFKQKLCGNHLDINPFAYTCMHAHTQTQPCKCDERFLYINTLYIGNRD